MTIILVIICICGIIWCMKSRKDIDKEEAAALKTPGKAKLLRENFGELIEALLSNPEHTVLFEREYDESIRIANLSNQELFVSYSMGFHGPEIHVACIEHSMLIKEWTFNTKQSINSIYLDITDYFK